MTPEEERLVDVIEAALIDPAPPEMEVHEGRDFNRVKLGPGYPAQDLVFDCTRGFFLEFCVQAIRDRDMANTDRVFFDFYLHRTDGRVYQFHECCVQHVEIRNQWNDLLMPFGTVRVSFQHLAGVE